MSQRQAELEIEINKAKSHQEGAALQERDEETGAGADGGHTQYHTFQNSHELGNVIKKTYHLGRVRDQRSGLFLAVAVGKMSEYPTLHPLQAGER